MNVASPFIDPLIIELIKESEILQIRIKDFKYPKTSLVGFFSGQTDRNLDAKVIETLEGSGIKYGYQLAAIPLLRDECNHYVTEGIGVKGGFVLAEQLKPLLDAIEQERVPVELLQQYRKQLLSVSLDELMSMSIPAHAGPKEPALLQPDQSPE